VPPTISSKIEDRPWLIVLTVAGLGVLFFLTGALLAEPGSRRPAASHYQVATSPGATILLDTTTGRSWRLVENSEGSRWEPIARPLTSEP
jgi:hypothetical protein